MYINDKEIAAGNLCSRPLTFRTGFEMHVI